MDALKALRRMVTMSGKSAMQVSRDMGVAEKYISMTLSRGSVPKLDTYADIAEACGYSVQLVSQNDVIIVDGKRRIERDKMYEKSLGGNK